MIGVELFTNGMLLGGLYAIFGLGLALIFGVMRIANVAHGDLAILGAFLVLVMPIPVTISIPLAILIGFAIGWALQHSLIDRIVDDDPMAALLVTFGLSVIIQNLLVEVFGPNNQSIQLNTLKTAAFPLFGLNIGVLPLGILVLSVLLFGGLHWTLKNTRIGRAIRATSTDAEVVGMFGIERKKIYAVVMALSVALAVIAGVLLAIRSSITPFSGAERLLIAFEVVVIGGLGSIWAAFLGGLVLALIHVISFYFDPASGQLYGHIALLLVLLLRPQGLIGKVVKR